jgi:hypothetical protein
VTDTGFFNQHFVRDIGIIQLFFGMAFGIGMIRPQLPHWAVGRGDVWLAAHAVSTFGKSRSAFCSPSAILGDFPAVSLPAVLGAALLCATLPTRRESRVRLRSIRRMLQYPA